MYVLSPSLGEGGICGVGQRMRMSEPALVLRKRKDKSTSYPGHSGGLRDKIFQSVRSGSDRATVPTTSHDRLTRNRRVLLQEHLES